jgi:hypothetical protein
MTQFRSISMRLVLACALGASAGASAQTQGGGNAGGNAGSTAKPLGAIASSAVKPGTSAKPGSSFGQRPNAPKLGTIAASSVKPASQVKSQIKPAASSTKPLGTIASSAVKPGTNTKPGTSARGAQLTLGSQAASTVKPASQGLSQIAMVATNAGPGSQGKSSTGRFRTLIKPITGRLPKLSSTDPGLLVVLADLSDSMNFEFAGQGQITKAHALADVVNGTILEFVDKMNVGGVIKPRLDVLMRGYGRTTRSLHGGKLAGQDIVSISDLADNPADEIEIDDGQGNKVPQPIWLRPLGNGNTPMRSTFAGLRGIVGKWNRRPAGKHLVLGVHVTDGESTDGDPLPEIEKFAQQVEQQGGDLLMTNIHLSSKGSPGAAVIFPDENDAAGFDDFGKMLFEASSPVPAALAEQLKTKPGARMMAYNAKPDQFAKVFEAGSSVAASQ